MKNRVVENLLVLSLVLIGSYFVFFAFVGLFYTIFEFSLTADWFVLFSISIFGIIGYGGLLSLLVYRFKKDLLFTFVSLICGLFSFIIYWFWTEYPLGELFVFYENNEFPKNLIFLWFMSISIYFTITIGRKLNKKILNE